MSSAVQLDSVSIRRSWPIDFSFSSPASSLASVCNSRRHPRLHRAPLVSSPGPSSLNERLVCEPLAGRTIYEAFEPRQGVVLDVTLVQPERKFVDVAFKVLGAGMVIDADQPALKDGKYAFNPVRRDVTADIFARAVVDCFVRETVKVVIDGRVVSVKRRTGFDIGRNRRANRSSVDVINRASDHLAAALTHPEDSRLTNRTAPGLEFLRGVLVRLLPANVSFVNLDDAL